MKLNKSLYGLKQSPRNWNRTINLYLLSIGFINSSADPCVYIRVTDSTIIVLYVDDLVISAIDQGTSDIVATELESRFDITDLGSVSLYLGMQVVRDSVTGSISIDQNHYVDVLLDRFNMTDCNRALTPATTTTANNLYSTIADSPLLSDAMKTTYKQVVGGLLYLSVCTRPDITHSIMQLTRRMTAPTDEDWANAKRVLRFLKGSKIGLYYDGDVDTDLTGYADADFAGDVGSRKSTTGYVFMYQGCAVSWRSKLQPIVTLSSTEAEYVALCSAAQEAVYLRRLFESIGEVQSGATVIFEDNMSTMALALREQADCSDRTKHIDVRYHYTRELITSNQIRLEHVATQFQLADMLTKNLDKVKFKYLSGLVMNLQV
jgi:Reverse transcriptase (RNA-dependent DNA polymerase)